MQRFLRFTLPLAAALGLSVAVQAQNGSVGIGTSTPNGKAALELNSTTKGFLPPRMTQAQRDALAPGTTEKGLLVFNTETNTLNLWNGWSWVNYLADSTPSGAAPTLAPVTFTSPYVTNTYTVPAGVTRLKVDMAGGKGGGADGGNGGRVQATLAVTPGQVLTIYPGTAGAILAPGFNSGGGSGGYANGGGSTSLQGGGGGGSSDIRIGGTALTNRVLVAGGGGGRSYTLSGYAAGGCGGGLTACNGAIPQYGFNAGGGGSQTGGGAAGGWGGATAGTLGEGGQGRDRSGGGGGGYYGGGGSSFDGTQYNYNGGGGGGGSSYADANLTSNVVHTQGYQAGGGYVTLTPQPAAPVLDGSNITNVPGTYDNLGNHTATQNLNLGTNQLVGTGSVSVGNNLNLGANQLVGNGGTQGLGLTSAGSLLLPAGVIQRGGTAITATSDLGLYSRVSGNFLRLVTNNAPIRFYADDDAGTTANVSIESNGNVGIGTGNTSPTNRLDVQNAAGRTGTHATGRALYVTGDFDQAAGGAEFRHYNGTQGVGIGYNSLYAAGSNVDQPLNLMPKGNGGVGIGTVSPGSLLDVNGAATVRGAANIGGNMSFGATVRQMVNLFNGDYGIGVQGGTEYFRSGDAFAWFTNGSHNDEQFNPGGGYTQMVLKNTFLGIGRGFSANSGPQGPLEIRRDNASPYIVMHDPNDAWFSFGMDFNDGRKIKINEGNGFSSTNYMTFSGTNVGIGTTNPSFPLDVQGTVTPGNYAYGWFNSNGQTGTTGGNTGPVSIRATGRVLATEFNATSDRRLKTVIGLSDAAQDLALLNRIRITDYTMKDRVQYGQRPFKKVIAQEVEQVFPQAVSQHSGFLPDVYAPATKAETQADSLLVLTLPAAPAAQAGQRVKLITKTGEVIGTVKAAQGKQLVVRGARQLAGQEVFVFGLEHADVRAVDYEALAMLNVSATQELARKVQALEQLRQQVAALQAELAASKTQSAQQLQQAQAAASAQTASLDQRLKALESLLGARAEAK
ncbi:tail fiber domain-containing protein [Hymenobacter jeollabukensis]|nr:tail fiber domain-containing protein [Hymenobacter jeollabukensis]